jgi:hypothetical protein
LILASIYLLGELNAIATVAVAEAINPAVKLPKKILLI